MVMTKMVSYSSMRCKSTKSGDIKTRDKEVNNRIVSEGGGHTHEREKKTTTKKTLKVKV